MGKLSGQTDGFLFLCLTGGRGKVAGCGFGGNRGKVGIWCLYLGDWGYGVRILLLNFDVCSREGSDILKISDQV